MTSAQLDPAADVEDRVGVDKAYADPHKVYMEGDSLFVAGTSSVGDAVDDIALPFGLTKGTQRYIDTERVLKANPKIRRIVGHSLGGAVSLELGKERPDLKTRTYGAPVVSMSGGGALQISRRPCQCLRLGCEDHSPNHS